MRHERPKRNNAARLRKPKQFAKAINEIWSTNFFSDALYDGRRLRALTMMDNFIRECLAIEVGQRVKGEDVVRVLERLNPGRDLPSAIKVDNRSALICKAMDRRAHKNGVELDFSRPGRQIDNAKVESFNGRLRQACLNAHWFLTLQDAQRKIEASRGCYKEARPDAALDCLAPIEFARRCALEPAAAELTEPEIPSPSGSKTNSDSPRERSGQAR